MELADRSARQRYALLIAQCLRPVPVFQAVREDEHLLQVERGLMLATAVCNPSHFAGIGAASDRLLESGAADLRVVDAAGHQRSHYPGLLLHAWRATFGRVEAQLTSAQRERWVDALTAYGARTNEANDLAGRVWWSLATNGAPSAPPPGQSEVLRVIRDQRSGGAFLPPDNARNPEAGWFQELLILHAVAAYAARAFEQDTATDAALRAAEYHLNETQPDHATNEPWGLLAFILNPNTHSLADQMLHTVKMLRPSGAIGVTAILLADVLDCLRDSDRLSG